jgi:transcriptional regulator with XRE-family HTH domain
MVRLRVKEIAESKGYNMSSLSRASDVSFNTIKRIFRDPYKEVTTTTLERIAKALGVPTSELIEDVPG